MGIGGISIWQLLIVLVIVILLFGTKKLRNLGADLGGAIKNFRGAMRDAESAQTAKDEAAEPDKLSQEQKRTDGDVIDAEVSRKETKPS